LMVVTDRYPRGASTECECLIFKKKMARVEALLEASMLEKRFRRMSFEDFIPKKGTKDAYDLALDYVARYEDLAAEGRGLTFLGETGVGKTFLACAILRELIHRKHIPGAIVYVPKLLDKIRSSYGAYAESPPSGKKRRTANVVMELVSTIDFLILDDLGAEKTSPWVMERLTMVVNDRYEKMLPTIVTSNEGLSRLAKRVGKRTVSRLAEMNRTVLMEGEDFRSMGIRDMGE
ncbi:MAG: ATP-binding protein, partial [Candidatus Tectomicrobia bacterium]|nr:ATP-binding protein [Candidatus Tectomicrobia bacterium]